MTEVAKKKKKRKKKRTDNKFRGGVISCMRRQFTMNSVKYEEVMKSHRVEVERLKKNGEPHKVPNVFYKCDKCGELDSNFDVDHIEPVIEFGKSHKDYTLDEIFNRIDCDIENLQLLCKPCHGQKTETEKELRKLAEAANKEKS